MVFYKFVKFFICDIFIKDFVKSIWSVLQICLFNVSNFHRYEFGSDINKKKIVQKLCLRINNCLLTSFITEKLCLIS